MTTNRISNLMNKNLSELTTPLTGALQPSEPRRLNGNGNSVNQNRLSNKNASLKGNQNKNQNQNQSFKKNQVVKKNHRTFTLIDFPEDGMSMGDFTGNSPKQAAKKAFTQLARKTGLENKNQKIVVFTIRERGTEKVHTYMGQRIRLARPIRVKIGEKTVTYQYQNVVTKYRGESE
jgi:hypothetical protein